MKVVLSLLVKKDQQPEGERISNRNRHLLKHSHQLGFRLSLIVLLYCWKSKRLFVKVYL